MSGAKTKKTKRRTQAERREEAETRMIQAALKLVSERGYDGFTLADAGEAAGYSRGLPAHYFGRKEDLLARVAQYVVADYHANVARARKTDPGLPHIMMLVRRYVAGNSNKSLSRALYALLAEAVIRPGLKRTIADLNAQGHAALQAELLAGIAAGNIRADVDVEHHAKAIYAFMRGQMSFAVLDPGYGGAAVGEAFIAMLESSLAPAQSAKSRRGGA